MRKHVVQVYMKGKPSSNLLVYTVEGIYNSITICMYMYTV